MLRTAATTLSQVGELIALSVEDIYFGKELYVCYQSLFVVCRFPKVQYVVVTRQAAATAA